VNDRTLTVQGTEVPKLGLGTWQVTGRDAVDGVRDALAMGYRHVDTARMYENETEVGEGIRSAGVERSEIFLTTKVWTADFAADRLVAAAEDSLRRLGTDYVDLLLLHWPNPDLDVGEPIGAMAGLRDRGLIRALGVSNFPTGRLEEALQHGPVFANQVEYHPYLAQPSCLQAREHDLLLEAYSPFAHGRFSTTRCLTEIGERRQERRPGGAALAARPAAGHARCPRRARTSAARETRRLDFELGDEDRERIDGLVRGLRTADRRSRPSGTPDRSASAATGPQNPGRPADHREAMLDIDACLRHLVEVGGSDLHLKVPLPPLCRIDGELVPIPAFDG
jgi:2,5-diketo-D-gluconate reductase B